MCWSSESGGLFLGIQYYLIEVLISILKWFVEWSCWYSIIVTSTHVLVGCVHPGKRGKRFWLLPCYQHPAALDCGHQLPTPLFINLLIPRHSLLLPKCFDGLVRGYMYVYVCNMCTCVYVYPFGCLREGEWVSILVNYCFLCRSMFMVVE